MKVHFFDIYFICTYARTEDAEPTEKYIIQVQLENVLEVVEKYGIKMVTGDLIAQVGGEISFRKTTSKESLHEVSNHNGTRLIDFSMGNNVIIKFNI